MNTLIIIILSIVGLLLILVYPKIIRYFLFAGITYATIMIDLIYALAYIPLLLMMWFFRRKNDL